MLSPIIDKRVYEGMDRVGVFSLEAGSKVIVHRVQTVEGKVTETVIGDTKAKGGSAIVRVYELQQGDILTAVAQMDAKLSLPSDPVTVQARPAPAKPIIGTLYAGAMCIHAWGVIPGSVVQVWNMPVSGPHELVPLGDALAWLEGQVNIPLRRPLDYSDSIRLDAVGGPLHPSGGLTDPVVPVRPIGSGPYAETLPTPEVGPLIACQETVWLSGLIPGAQIQIFVKDPVQSDASFAWRGCLAWTSLAQHLGRKLLEGQEVRASQGFETLNLKSELSPPIIVGGLDKVTRPRVFAPIWEGATSVSVFDLLTSAKVEIAVDGDSKGTADFDREHEFGLGYPLKSGQRVKARQGLCDQWGPWSDEVTVEALSGSAIITPTVEKPLYACANYVRVTDVQNGGLVEVYVDKIYAGEDKSPLIQVVPHLQAHQHVTAIQRVGSLISKESRPVEVQEVPELLLPPKLEDPVDWCSGHVTASDLLPGALVNVFQNKLLIGCIEAVDRSAHIPLAKLWPGAVIYANQTLCGSKSADSKTASLVGYIGVPLYGSWPVPNPINSRVETKCPVPVDTQVKISSVRDPIRNRPDPHYYDWEDPGVIAVQGTGTAIIPAGKSEVEFTVVPVKAGFCFLKVEANHYIQVARLEDFSSTYPYLVRMNIEWQTWPDGVILEQDKIEVTEGETFDFKFTLNPSPWADCEVDIDCYDPDTTDSPLAQHLSIQPSKVIIPAGQKSGTAKVTALKKGPISGELRAFATYYGGTLCHLTIKAAPAPPPTPPTPSKRQQSWKMLLQWQAPARGGLVYVWGQTYPIPNGKLKKVRNINTTYPWRHHLWFPGPGFSTDDAFDPNKGYLLNSGAEATPAQLNLPESLDRSFLIGATPSPIDLPPTTPLPDMGSVYIELVYET